MPIEHSGGKPEVGYEISVDTWCEHSFAVPIVHFDHDAVDTMEDKIREALANGTITPFVHQLTEQAAERGRVEGITALLGEVLALRKNKEVAIIQMGLAAGLTVEASSSQLAKQCGVSKEGMEQAVERYRERFGLGQNRNMRTEKARENMRLRNCRPGQKLAKKGKKKK